MGIFSFLSRKRQAPAAPSKPSSSPAPVASSHTGQSKPAPTNHTATADLSNSQWEREVFAFFKERYALEKGDLPESIRSAIAERSDKTISPLAYTNEVAKRFGFFAMY